MKAIAPKDIQIGDVLYVSSDQGDYTSYDFVKIKSGIINQKLGYHYLKCDTLDMDSGEWVDYDGDGHVSASDYFEKIYSAGDSDKEVIFDKWRGLLK